MDDNRLFKLQIISPDKILFDGNADMIELKTTEGEMGVLKGHIPLTAILAPGVLRIMENGNVKEAAVHNGFVKILKESVSVMAESCEWPDEIDINRANEAKIRAERRLKGGDSIDVMRAELALKRALTRLELADKSSRK